MITIVYVMATAIIFWKLGRKYQDFQDIMLARRVSKLVSQREQLQKEQDDYERYERQDRKIRRIIETEPEDEAI